MYRIKTLLIFSLLLLLGACKTTQNSVTTPKDDGKIEVVFLHINDVYEINPLENGKVGGMARLATVKKNLVAKNKNLLTVHAGDFLNPSLIGSLKFEGQRIRGKQMVEMMNVIGVDLVTFGNHEFDLNMPDLQMRLNESDFDWLGTSVLQRTKEGELEKLEPFYKMKGGKKAFCPETFIWEVEDADGTKAKIGIFGTTIDSNPKDYVYYEDHYQAAIQAYLELAAKTDVVVGLTHLELLQDLKLASMLPNVPILMGGHDHDNMKHTVGNVVIAKADANAKSAYIHRLILDKNTGKVQLHSDLKKITDAIVDDPKAAAVAEKWNVILKSEISKIISNPDEVIYVAKEPLDGLEKHIRHHATNLTDIIAASFAVSEEGIEASILNGGSIRIDDYITGEVTPVDIFRTLPFGGDLAIVDIKGSLLQEVLNVGWQNKGVGGFLHWHNIEYNKDTKQWSLNGKPLDVAVVYTIAMPSFLLTGNESGMNFLTKDNPGIVKVHEIPEGSLRTDVRKVVIDYLKKI